MLGILLVARRPLSVAEVVAELHRHGVTTSPHLSKAPARVVADMLAYQMRAGRVRRTARGTYVLTAAMSRTTTWRYTNWHRLLSAVDDDPGVAGPGLVGPDASLVVKPSSERSG